MTTNRHLISEQMLVRHVTLLDRGSSIPFFTKQFVVDAGTVAVMTVGGAYKETLQPGTYFLNRYKRRRDVQSHVVNDKIQNFMVTTNREFTIQNPVPVEINLNLSIEYQVSDPIKVALEIDQPLGALFDRTIQAVRGAIVYASIDEIRQQGHGIAQTTLQNLRAMKLPSVIGIDVINVMTTSIKATDTGSDELANLQMTEMKRAREHQMDQQMLASTQVTWEWMLLNRPEIAQQLIAQHGALAKEMLDKGILDPSGQLNSPTGSSGMNVAGIMNQLGPGQFMSGGGFPSAGVPTQSHMGGQPQLGHSPQQLQPPQQQDVHTRMSKEIELIKSLPGAIVEAKAGVNEHGIPDNSYNLRVQLPRRSGGMLEIFIICMQGYPEQQPIVEVLMDGQEVPVTAGALSRWQPSYYLLEIVREVQNYYG